MNSRESVPNFSTCEVSINSRFVHTPTSPRSANELNAVQSSAHRIHIQIQVLHPQPLKSPPQFINPTHSQHPHHNSSYGNTSMDSLSLPSLLYFSLFCILFSILHRFILNPSSTAPTPSYGFLAFYNNRRRLLDWYTALLASSPSQTIVIRRVGARRTIVTASPDNVEHILKTNFYNYPKGKPFTDMLGDLLGRGIFNADGALWLSQRKLASHEFTARCLRELLFSALEYEADGLLLPFLASACRDRQAVDLQDVLRRFAFDVICKISLGADLGLLGPSELADSPFAAAFEAASTVSAGRGSASFSALWKVKRALSIGSERRLHQAVALIHEHVTDIIRRRKSDRESRTDGSGRNDLLSRLIAGGHGDEAIRDMAISFIMAGRDTTSSALTWFFHLISGHPTLESELIQEITTASRNSKLNYDRLKELKLLEASLYESMRLYPPVVWDSKHAEDGDVLPDGTRVEPGDRVTYMRYAMGRMERIWGEDWREFKPRRWLGEENGEVKRVSAYKYPVFQGGPRVCLGKEMAFVQMKYVAAAVMARFEVRRVEMEAAPAVVPMLTAHMEGGLKVVIKDGRL